MILFLKAVRSIWRGKRSYIACITLMAIGISVYTSFNMLYQNLESAKNHMYEQQRFADVFASVRDIPLSTAQDLARIPGVAEADGRITASARVDLPGRENNIITLHMLSYDPDEPNPLNAFLLTSGIVPARDEILVSDAFMEANGLLPGDSIKLTINGRPVTAVISGAAQSPEYVYAIPDIGTMLPDNSAFGFAFMPYPALAAITGTAGSADSLAFMLEDSMRFEDVRLRLEDALAPYGLLSLYSQKDQPSNAMLTQEINSMGGMATSMPMIFILMAVVILYIMLGRVIEQERGSIGVLKAFGFSDFEVTRHYVWYGLITGGLGGLLGALGGLGMSGWFTEIFLEFFHLPALANNISPGYMAAGMAIALASGGLGAFMGTRKMLSLSPSEAMRPPTPPPVKGDVLGKLPFLMHMLASHGYMAMRNITRSWFRSLFIVVGVAFSFAIIAFSASYSDMMDKLMLEQFTHVQLYDVKVTMQTPQPYTAAVESVYGVGGVSHAEGMLEIPARLRKEHLRKDVALTGIAEDARLQKIYDTLGEFHMQPPRGGLIISASLARELEAKRGDVLMMRTPYTGEKELPIPVMDIVNENIGMTAYVELGSLSELLGIPKSASSVVIGTFQPERVKSALQDGHNVTAVTDQVQARKVIDDMMVTYSSMYFFMQIAGAGIAFAIITNTSSISLSERKREYATLRVLGMHPREITRILGFEYWLLTLIGFIPGVPLVRAMKAGIAGMMENNLFTIPLDSPLSSYITGAVGCILTVALCNLLAARQIAKFDMVEVLKERE